ncbi:MAG: isochorismatase family cysteine hydrolase [Candidatus Onthomonas sp.]|nr:isochorismatase family cysteine hydrolase [Candidatus Onthomonas sp.]
MRKLLLVIDMQRDFVDGALGTPEAVKIVPNVVRKIKAYPRENVIATRDTHGADYLQTQEGQKLPVVHCVRGTPGWELVPEVAEALGDAQIVDKPTFGSVALARQIAALAEQEPIAIELVGLCTDICVVSNALLLKAMMPEVPISVDPACCAGVTVERHRMALATMESCQIMVEEI